MADLVGIVGAGLAGLTAAYRLKQAGVQSVIYEGSKRAGGRVLTGMFPNGQLYQKGGELIDTDHEDIIQLVEEMGLELIDLLADETPGTKEVNMVKDYSVDPPQMVRYTEEEAAEDYRRVFPRVAADAEAAYPGDTFETNEASIRLDQITLEDYVDEICSVLGPDGSKTKFAQLLKVAYTEEYGAEPCEQSSLNLIFLMGFGDPEVYSLFGPSDERFTVKGGNSLLVKALVERLAEHPHPVEIKYNHKLLAVKKQGHGYRLTFEQERVVHSTIVLALPFSTLREADLTKSGFSPLKLYAIKHLPMGRNTKMNVQFEDRYWRALGYNGSTHATTDTKNEGSYQSTWEVTRGQPGRTGILVNYTGGDYAEHFTSTSCIKESGKRNYNLTSATSDFLYKLDPLYPGTFEHFQFVTPSRVTNVNVTAWKDNIWTKGSYSYYRLGQYSAGMGRPDKDGCSSSVVAFANTEWEPEGSCHFAGEHTSFDYQGYMNGAVVSGNRVAEEILEQ